jgi:hypothetical protein
VGLSFLVNVAARGIALLMAADTFPGRNMTRNPLHEKSRAQNRALFAGVAKRALMPALMIFVYAGFYS